MSALEDGTYDVMVVDARDADGGAITVDLAVSSGPHRGDVVTVHAARSQDTWMDLLGAPGTLVVTGGEPTFHIDR